MGFIKVTKPVYCTVEGSLYRSRSNRWRELCAEKFERVVAVMEGAYLRTLEEVIERMQRKWVAMRWITEIKYAREVRHTYLDPSGTSTDSVELIHDRGDVHQVLKDVIADNAIE